MHHKLNSAVGIFSSPQDAEIAILALQKSGYDMKKLSMVGGNFISWMMAALSLGGLLASIGIPQVSIHQYENALKANKFILIAQGSLPEVEKATAIFLQNKAGFAVYHHLKVHEIADLT